MQMKDELKEFIETELKQQMEGIHITEDKLEKFKDSTCLNYMLGRSDGMIVMLMRLKERFLKD